MAHIVTLNIKSISPCNEFHVLWEISWYPYFYPSGDRCSQVPVVDHATANTVFAIYGTVVQYQCQSGYQFSDNVTVAYLKCSREEQAWNDTLPDCIRKS